MNKKIILYIACSLDGFIARKNHDISWLFMDQTYGFEEFEKSFGAAVMGRKTYDFSRQFSDPPFKGKKNFIVTTQRDLYPSSTDELVFCGYDDVIRYIKDGNDGEGIFLVGGVKLIADFINDNLLDEIVVAFHPVILGDGIPLFHGINKEVMLEYKGTEEFSTGLVKLKYLVKKQ